MNVEITVGGLDKSEERLAKATAALLKELRVNVEPNAKFVTHAAQADDKGIGVSLSQIVLALVSGGAVSKLITSLFDFLSINRKLRLKLKKPDGETIEFSLDYLDRNGSAKAMQMIEAFLKT